MICLFLSIQTYRAAIYSIVAATFVLLIGAILKDDNVLVLPTSLIGIMAIARTSQVILDMRRHPHHCSTKPT
jgi:hypothetical protein